MISFGGGQLRMYSTARLLFLSLVTLFGNAFSDSSFSQPPPGGPVGNYQDNPSYKVGQKIDVQWSSNLTTMDLFIWQQYPLASETDQYYDNLLEDSRSTSIIWTVTLDGYATNVGKGESAIFYLAIYPSGSGDIDATSHYFNVSVSESAATSASASKHDMAKATTASSSDDLSTGAVAGIAAGATVGGLLILGAIGFLAWKQLRRRTSVGYTAPSQQPPLGDSKSPGQDSAWIQPPKGHPPAQSPQGIYEAPTETQHQIYEAP